MVDTSPRHRVRPRVLPAVLIFVSLLLLAAALPSCGEDANAQLEWIRRGRVYLRVRDKGQIRIQVEPAHGPADYAYLYGPDGRTLERKRLSGGFRGTLTRALDAGPGTYILIPSPSHRMRIEVTGAELTFEPETDFPSLFQKLGGSSYTLRVPEGCQRFTFCATNQQDWEGSPAVVRLFRPDGQIERAFEFDALDENRILERLGITPEMAAHYKSQGDTAEVPEFRLLIERHEVRDPAAGLWRVEAGVTGPKSDDIGFWLEGIGNRFAPAGSVPFDPELAPVSAEIRIDARRAIGPCGDVGVVWGWTGKREETLEVFRTLGLSADKHFFPQVDMEMENDDDDPRHIRWDGFLFAPFLDRMNAYREQALPLTSLMAITRITPWAVRDMEEVTEYVEACVRYHVVEAGLDPAKLYWQFLNEPNHDVALSDYVAAFRAAGRRLAATLGAEGIDVHFGGPSTGNAWRDAEAVPWEWLQRLIAEADAELDFVVWNQYRLGRLEDTWRYRKHIARVDSLLRAHDTDGRLEEIVIGATNLRGGIVLQKDRQDGAYSALWWPSTLCQALGTGRCRLINYFFLVDQGARRKGLLTADWKQKPVAHATAFFNAYRGDVVLSTATDHDGLDVLATRDGPNVHTLLVNRTGREVDVRLRFVPPDAREWRCDASRLVAATGAVRAMPELEMTTDTTEGDAEAAVSCSIGPDELMGFTFQANP